MNMPILGGRIFGKKKSPFWVGGFLGRGGGGPLAGFSPFAQQVIYVPYVGFKKLDPPTKEVPKVFTFWVCTGLHQVQGKGSRIVSFLGAKKISSSTLIRLTQEERYFI